MGIERSISQSNVVMAYDATKVCSELELNLAIKTVRMKDGILRRGDKLVVLGVLHLVPHPRKCSTECVTETFLKAIVVPTFTNSL